MRKLLPGPVHAAGVELSARRQEAQAAAVVAAGLLVLPGGQGPLLASRLGAPGLLLVLLGVELEVFAQAAGIRVLLLAARHLAPVGLLAKTASTVLVERAAEPVFVDLLRSPGIDFQLAGRYDNPFCRTGSPGYMGWLNRFLGIDF